VSNVFRNILGVNWVLKGYSCQMGVNIFRVSNGCENILVVRWV